MKVRKIRDLSLIDLDEKKTMVVACDSCGGIGNKANDVLSVSPYYVGKLTSRVAILEVLCVGAEIITITDAVCNEMEITGKEIIRGIKEELHEAGIEDIVLTGSTEENFKTSATALGITVIGIVENEKLKINTVSEEAVIVSIGLPKVGAEIDLSGDKEIIDYKTVKKLLQMNCVYEIVPVGSKGIAYEANQIALNNNLSLTLIDNIKRDIKKSAGPATCIIAAIKTNSIFKLSEFNLEVNIIGYLKK